MKENLQCSRTLTMSLSLLQSRLKKNEEDFARLNAINFDDDVKDVKKK